MGEVSIGTQTLTVYGTQDGLKDYWAATLSGIASTDGNTQKQSLVEATRWMDTIGLVDPETGDAIAPTVDDVGVPEPVITASYELANALILDPSIRGNQENGGNNIKQVGAGSAQVQFFRPSDGSTFPTYVQRLLRDYIAGPSSDLYGQATGTGDESSFKDASFPGLTEGFK